MKGAASLRAAGADGAVAEAWMRGWDAAARRRVDADDEGGPGEHFGLHHEQGRVREDKRRAPCGRRGRCAVSARKRAVASARRVKHPARRSGRAEGRAVVGELPRALVHLLPGKLPLVGVRDTQLERRGGAPARNRRLVQQLLRRRAGRHGAGRAACQRRERRRQQLSQRTREGSSWAAKAKAAAGLVAFVERVERAAEHDAGARGADGDRAAAPELHDGRPALQEGRDRVAARGRGPVGSQRRETHRRWGLYPLREIRERPSSCGGAAESGRRASSGAAAAPEGDLLCVQRLPGGFVQVAPEGPLRVFDAARLRQGGDDDPARQRVLRCGGGRAGAAPSFAARAPGGKRSHGARVACGRAKRGDDRVRRTSSARCLFPLEKVTEYLRLPRAECVACGAAAYSAVLMNRMFSQPQGLESESPAR